MDPLLEVIFEEVALGSSNAVHLRLHNELSLVIVAEFAPDDESLLAVEGDGAKRDRYLVLLEKMRCLVFMQVR